MTAATVPWEAFDPTHSDHQEWVERSGRCLADDCAPHADLAARRRAVLDRMRASNDKARGITTGDGPEVTR